MKRMREDMKILLKIISRPVNFQKAEPKERCVPVTL